MTFGERLKAYRLKSSKTLTEFCDRHDLDKGNWSRAERDLIPPPQNRDKLRSLASLFQLKEGSKAWHDFMDSAYATLGHIPPDLMKDEEFRNYLPNLFYLVRKNGMKVFNGE